MALCSTFTLALTLALAPPATASIAGQTDLALAAPADTAPADAAQPDAAQPDAAQPDLGPTSAAPADAAQPDLGPTSAAPADAAETTGDYVIVDAAPPRPSDTPAPPAVQFSAGAMLMTRAEFLRARPIEGDASSRTVAPTRLRGRLEARAGQFRAYAELQDARNLGDPLGPARAGFHQAFAEYDAELRHAHLLIRAGRQEFDLGTHHLFGTAPWAAGMRSWDAFRVEVTTPRGGVNLFAGSLARPLLSARQRLVDHVASRQDLTWVIDAHVRIRDALVIEALVMGGHERDAIQSRNIITTGLHLYGDIAPGLRYDAEGHVQAGEIDIARATQLHLAGSAFAQLEYLSPRALDPAGKVKLGGGARLDFVSGSKCDSAEVDSRLPCTTGRNADFHSPWMARHRWFGRGDRFWASNVIDAALDLRMAAAPTKQLALTFFITNHLFAFPEPGGMWRNIGSNLIGVAPDNRDRLAAHEVDVEAQLRYRWLRLQLGWHVVTSLSGGRAVSGLAQWQRIYVELQAIF